MIDLSMGHIVGEYSGLASVGLAAALAVGIAAKSDTADAPTPSIIISIYYFVQVTYC